MPIQQQAQAQTQKKQKQIDIRCRETGRLLARADNEGVYYFCRQQNTSHLITWERLREMEKEIVVDGKTEKYLV